MSADLAVWLDNRRAATVERSDSGLVLTYIPEYLGGGYPLSLSLPQGDRSHSGARVEWWLRSHLPDNPSLVRRWGENAQGSDVVALLSTPLGLDCAGAVRFAPDGINPDERGGSLLEMSEDEVETELAWVIAGMPGREMSDLYCSLPGFHPKLALRRTGQHGGWARPTGDEASTHILKPRAGHEKVVPVTEHMMLETAHRCGLGVPKSWLEPHGDMTVLVVERYDRKLVDGRWRRLHQEDFGQALGLAPEKRSYAAGGPGIEAVAGMLRSASQDPQESLSRFAAGLIWAWITADIDAHARNYAVLWDESLAPTFAPLYDRNTSLPFRKQNAGDLELAMPYGGTSRIGDLDEALPNSLETLAAAVGIPVATVREHGELIAERAPDALSDALKTLSGGHRRGIRRELRCLQSRLSKRSGMFLKGMGDSAPTRRSSPRQPALP